jgi:predicted enzyme related to lactoylglutathione lyase
MSSPFTFGDSNRRDPESFRGRELTASLTVKDLERSLAWYRDVVGFTVDQVFERDGRRMAVSLKAGVVRILLSQDDGAKGLDRGTGEGFSLMITTAQDVDALARGIKDRGGVLASEPAEMHGARGFRLVDLDGFKLTIASAR